MLDAFIIEKIKREREESREAPGLRITPPAPDPQRPLPPPSEGREDSPQRGVVEIDFNLDSNAEPENVGFYI